MSLAFWITTLIVVASPGTGVAFTLAAGLSRGARASLVAAFGCTLGIAPHVAAAMLGLAAVLHASAVAFAAVKYAGVAYLLFMAWNALREGGSLSVDAAPTRRSDLRVVVDAVAGQPAQSQAVDLLRRLPAAVRRRQRGASAHPHGRTLRRLHGARPSSPSRSTASSPPRRAAMSSIGRACSPGSAAASPPPSARWR